MRRATNSNVMKDKNEKLILNLIRENSLSRADLSKITKLTRASISLIIGRLVSDGIILETGVEANGVGRKPTMLTINKDAFFVIGVNISRKRFDVGITNLYGELLCEKKGSIAGKSPQDVLNEVVEVINEQIASLSLDRQKILGIGISTPGPVNYKDGTILTPPNFNEWHNIKVAEILNKATGFDAKLDNISSAIALSEKYFGVGKAVSNFLLLLVDEGIGSGIIINDAVFRGANGLGNEIGHTSIKYDGMLCECGNIGCLEKYASMKSILQSTNFSSWCNIMDNLHNDEALQILLDEVKYLTPAIINAINLFNLDMVVISGDICYNADEMIGQLKSSVEPKVMTGSVLIKANAVHSRIVAASVNIIYDFFN